MTCSVYNSTNIVDTSHSASEWHINFTAERVGPLELSCDIICTQGVITFNISWTVVGKYVHTYINVGNNCSLQLEELEDALSEHIHSVLFYIWNSCHFLDICSPCTMYIVNIKCTIQQASLDYSAHYPPKLPLNVGAHIQSNLRTLLCVCTCSFQTPQELRPPQ